MMSPLKFALSCATALLLAAPVLAQTPPRPAGPAEVGTPSAAEQQAGLAPTDATLLGATPLPPGAKILSDQSLIVGSGDAWVGRVSLDVGRDVTSAYKYFLDAFQAQGWTLQSAVRARTSLLVFTRFGRSATIEFQDAPRLMGGAIVTLTMAPVGSVTRY